jgi:GNAT superfamily N-acetyltransferase
MFHVPRTKLLCPAEIFFAVMVIGGERAWVCDEAIVYAEDPLIGIATIAPEGEGGSGQPTIVGIYVRPADRKHGYGTALLAAAIRRCLERGFDNIRVDTLTKSGKKTVDKLPTELRVHLDIHDLSHLTPF